VPLEHRDDGLVLLALRGRRRRGARRGRRVARHKPLGETQGRVADEDALPPTAAQREEHKALFKLLKERGAA
jgi:hypothetical protein